MKDTRPRPMVGAPPGAAVTLALSALPAPAITVAPGECREASQVIGNAARARDNGMSREQFVDRFDEDIVLPSSMRPENRWFVHGEAETRFLRAAVNEVLDTPRPPPAHERELLSTCLDAAARQPPGWASAALCGARPAKLARRVADRPADRHSVMRPAADRAPLRR